jgi:long-chain acyl-CoA synthetase
MDNREGMTEDTIYGLFQKSAVQKSDTIAFNYFDQTWKKLTYLEVLVNTKGIASHLLKTGIKKGDRIAIYAENKPEWCEAYLAITLAGGTAVPIDAQLGPHEIRTLLADSESKILFFSTQTEPNVQKALEVTGTPSSKDITLIKIDSPDFQTICGTEDIQDYPQVHAEDVASLIYTSGTTGIPKGVQLTHRNFCYDAGAVIAAKIVTPSDHLISVLPLHHTYPFICFLISIFLGITTTFTPSLKGPELVQTIREKGITILIGVPQLLELIRNGIFNKIRQLPGFLSKTLLSFIKICRYLRPKTGINLGKVVFQSVHKSLGKQLRFFASGGAKLNADVMKDLEALGFTVVEGYGLTETAPVVTFNPLEKRKPGSVGKALPSVDVKIVDPEKDKVLGPMEEGEIALKGPMVMPGYFKNEHETQKVLKEGWFFSGDIGYLDSDGYVFITGRLKEVIVLSSGKNIYPEEVEKRYLTIPYIKDLCVMGMGDQDSVDALHAVIVPDFEYAKKAQVGNLLEDLKGEINDVSVQLPPYMRIKKYTVYPDPLPRTPLGKLRRFMIDDLLAAKDKELRTRTEDKNLIGDETAQKVVACIRPLLKEKIPIQAKDNLELDLGLDSLARIELVVSLETAFSVKLSETFVSEIQTVEELIMKIKEHGDTKAEHFETSSTWMDMLHKDPDPHDIKKVGLRHNFFELALFTIILGFVKLMFKLCFRLKVEGIENLPEKKPYIITPNHASYIDGFAVAAALPMSIFKHVYSIGLQKYFRGPIKYFAKIAHIIPIDRETYLHKAIQMSFYVLKNGKSLLIFPEGTRSFDGEIMEFKKGVGILALEFNVPLIPTYIKGSFDVLARGTVRPRFNEIKIILGQPIYPSDLDFTKKPEDVDDYQFFVNEVRERVKALKESQ